MKRKNIIYNILAFFLRLFMKLRFSPKVIGQDNIPSKKVILIANHKSNYDFISMGLTSKRNIHFLAKDSLFKGILKWVMKGVKAIPISRQNKNHQAIDEAINYLNEDEIIGIFPEGTFNKTKHAIGEFKLGSVIIAYKTQAPIIPIAIGNYKRKKLIIKIGKPIYIRSSNYIKENKKVQKEMIKLLRGINENN